MTPAATDAQMQPTPTVLVAFQTPNATPTVTVFVSLVYGNSGIQTISAISSLIATRCVLGPNFTSSKMTCELALVQELDTVRHVSQTPTVTGMDSANVTMAGLDQTALNGQQNAILSVHIAVMDLPLTIVIIALKTPFVTTTQSLISTRNVFVHNGGPVMTVASIVDPVRLHVMAVLDLMQTNVKTVLQMLTTKLMEPAAVVMNGWDLTAHTNAQIAMRHAKSV